MPSLYTYSPEIEDISTESIRELFKYNNLTPPAKMVKKEITLYWGGPVETKHIFFIHSSDYKSNDPITSNKDFTVTRTNDILFDIDWQGTKQLSKFKELKLIKIFLITFVKNLIYMFSIFLLILILPS